MRWDYSRLYARVQLSVSLQALEIQEILEMLEILEVQEVLEDGSEETVEIGECEVIRSLQ